MLSTIDSERAEANESVPMPNRAPDVLNSSTGGLMFDIKRFDSGHNAHVAPRVKWSLMSLISFFVAMHP